ncbi:MAG: hypothetical protein IT235_02955 [Bacteroidia bacterium]|nr:hypothetical protein [Bacteroidia bacterium]
MGWKKYKSNWYYLFSSCKFF